MAGTQWTGEHAKCKSMQEAKAILRHNDKDLRDQHEHSNPHINPEETYRNQSYYGLSYEERCEKVDRLVAEGLSKRTKKVATGKNAPTLTQNVTVAEPKGMQDMPDETATRWFNRVCDIAVEQFGDCLIDADLHCDEIHKYTDSETKKRETSRRHGHLAFVPLVDGKLNGKSFSARKNIIGFNNAIQKMTQEEFRMKFMDGTGKKGDKDVPELKAASEALEIEMLADAGYAEKMSALEDEKGEAAFQMHQAEEKMRDADQKQRKSDKMLKKATIKYRWLKVKELDGREEALDEREREQDTKEEELNAREASLSAREAQIRAREEGADEFHRIARESARRVNAEVTTPYNKLCQGLMATARIPGRLQGVLQDYVHDRSHDIGLRAASAEADLQAEWTAENERRKQAEMQLGT